MSNRDSSSNKINNNNNNICNSICCIYQHRFRGANHYGNSTCNSSYNHSTSKKKAKTNIYGRVCKKAHSTTATK